MSEHTQPPCPFCGSPFTGPATDVEGFTPTVVVYACHDCGQDFPVTGCSTGACGGGCSCGDEAQGDGDAPHNSA